jgi:hypothetical protein
MMATQTQQQQHSDKNARAIAKPFSEKGYFEGQATDDMPLREVIALCPEFYGKVKATNFGTNWQ